MILFVSSSETLGSITICAISSSVPNIGNSIFGIELKNCLTSSGVISTFEIISSCISSASFCVLLISNNSSLNVISSFLL